MSCLNFLPENDISILFADSSVRDSFGRIRISYPETIFESKFIFDDLPLFWDELLVTGGSTSFNSNQATVDISTTSSVGSRAVRQTYRYFNYQPGKSKLIFFTGVMETSGGITGVRARIGNFDDVNDKTTGVINGNGFYFELDGSNLSVVKRSYITGSQVDTKVDQSSWNIDTLDGNGDSGVTLDASKAQIMFLDQEWLGVGSVRMGFVIDGFLYYCHQFNHANLIGTTYNGNPNLPIRYELENVSGSSAAQMKQICTTVISEGGFQPTGSVRTIDRKSSGTESISTTEEGILAFRTKSTHNRMSLKLITANLLSTTSDNVEWRIYHDAGATGTWTSLSNSGIEYIDNLTGFTAGEAIFSLYSTSSGGGRNTKVSLESTLLPGSTIEGTSQITVVTARNLSGTANVLASLQIQEVF